jgi:hypothetical protein
MSEEKKSAEGVTLLTIIASLFAGWIGVQSKKNRDRDFQHGKFSHFIIGGVIFLILFILTVVGVVQLVLSNAGPTAGS